MHSGIAGGEPDGTDSNVFLLVSHRGTEGLALCSASLIAPNLLLTARHCVADVSSEQVTCGTTTAGDPFPASTFFAANTASIDDVTRANAFKVAAISVPTEDSDICGYDLALVTLTTSVPASVAKPLIPRIDRAVRAGEAYTAVGYGTDQPGDAGTAGLRRGRTGLKVNCVPGHCSIGVEATEFVGEAGVCSGDSGGPALDVDGKVVGVVSRSAEDCKYPVYGSVAAWKNWLAGVATAAAAKGKYAVPFWVTTGSSDGAPVSDGVGASTAGGGSGSTGTPTAEVAGQASESPAEAQGQACSLTNACPAGYGCYSPTSSATAGDAYCAAHCTAQAQCSSGTACDLASSVCIAPLKAHSDSNSSACALSAGAPRGGSGAAAALAAVVLALTCRKRRAS
ncbi:MAG: trypsin-like serine protease [Polyangiaceae bacterium]